MVSHLPDTITVKIFNIKKFVFVEDIIISYPYYYGQTNFLFFLLNNNDENNNLQKEMRLQLRSKIGSMKKSLRH